MGTNENALNNTHLSKSLTFKEYIWEHWIVLIFLQEWTDTVQNVCIITSM